MRRKGDASASARLARSAWGILTETIDEWQQDRASHLAAALAFYTVLSIAPILIIAVAVTGRILGPHAAEERILEQMSGFVGPQGARVISTILRDAGQSSLLATAIGLLTLLFGATAVLAELREALNCIWGVAPTPGQWLRNFFRKRLLSFLALLGAGVLLLASLVATTALAALTRLMPSADVPWRWIEFFASLAVVTLLFALLYRTLPDAKIAWIDLWVGASATALLFNLGKLLIGLYLGRSTVSSAYGAAGSLVLFLLWLYYSTQIFFLGAEFTEVFARHRGSDIVPEPHAARVQKHVVGSA